MADGEGLIIKIFADAKDFNTGVSKAIGDAKSKFKGLGDELGKELKRVETVGTTAFKGITGAIGGMATAVAAAIGGMVKESVSAFAEYEQLEGGVATMFKNDAEYIINRASAAFRTAGVSANKYMETVTSFSASLIQSLGGDTRKAAEYADRAMVDMSDNANKMGTDISSIQNAYQGFAKQNYTMLDNLKLGYGGTKEEMARLIEDASKLTNVQKDLGITVDANSMSFGNIVNAISVMQKQMGIAGTTSEEAERTISGSLNMMSAAWENLKTNLLQGEIPLDESINDLVYSVEKVIENAGPAIEKSLKGLGMLIQKALPALLDFGIPALVEDVLPGIGAAAVALVESLATEISKNLGKFIEFVSGALPNLVNVGVQLITSILEGISSNISSVRESAGTIISSLADGIRSVMQNLLPIAKDLIGIILSGFIEYKTLIFEIGIELITALVDGIADSAPTLGPQLVDAVLHLLDVLIVNLPTLIDATVKIITELTNAIMAKLPDLLGKVGQVVYDLCNKLLDHLPELLQDAVKIVAAVLALVAEILLAALISIGQHLVDWWNNSIKPWFDKIGDNIKNFFSTLGKAFEFWWNSTIRPWFEKIKTDVKTKVEEIKTSISEKVEAIKTKVSETVSNIKAAVSEKVSDIKSGISEKVSSIKTAVSEKVTDIKTKVVDTVSNLKTSISDKISAIKTNVTTKVEEIKTNVKDKVSSIKDTVVNTIKELPGKMLDVGKNIVEGLWNGITDAKEWLKGRISDLVGDVTGWFKDKLGINSPSKVFAEFGKYMTEGLAVGMDKETNMLKNTAEDQISQLAKIYDGISLGAPRFAGSGPALSRMKQSIQTITNDNGNVFNFYQTFEGADAAAGEAMFRQFQRKVRYAGGVL